MFFNENEKINLEDALKLVESDPKGYAFGDGSNKTSFYSITRDKGGWCGDFIGNIEVPRVPLSVIETHDKQDFFVNDKSKQDGVLAIFCRKDDTPLMVEFFSTKEGKVYSIDQEKISQFNLDISFLDLKEALLNLSDVGTTMKTTDPNVGKNKSVQEVIITADTPEDALETVFSLNRRNGEPTYSFVTEMDIQAYNELLEEKGESPLPGESSFIPSLFDNPEKEPASSSIKP